MVGESFHHSGWRGEDVNHIKIRRDSPKPSRLFALLVQSQISKFCVPSIVTNAVSSPNFFQNVIGSRR